MLISHTNLRSLRLCSTSDNSNNYFNISTCSFDSFMQSFCIFIRIKRAFRSDCTSFYFPRNGNGFISIFFFPFICSSSLELDKLGIFACLFFFCICLLCFLANLLSFLSCFRDFLSAFRFFFSAIRTDFIFFSFAFFYNFSVKLFSLYLCLFSFRFFLSPLLLLYFKSYSYLPSSFVSLYS